MDQAVAAHTTNPSIELIKKGERAAIEGAPAHRNAVADKQRLYIVAAREIERLLDLLDRLDGDPDLEDGHDAEPTEDPEPSIGWTEMLDQAGRQRFGYPTGSGDDLEAEHDGREPDVDREDDGDAEPSLGSYNVSIGRVMVDDFDWLHRQGQDIDPGMDQRSWSMGGTDDLEVESDSLEPDELEEHYRQRLAERRKIGPTVANVVARRNWSLGKIEIIRR
jgi:hypothetical protein